MKLLIFGSSNISYINNFFYMNLHDLVLANLVTLLKKISLCGKGSFCIGYEARDETWNGYHMLS